MDRDRTNDERDPIMTEITRPLSPSVANQQTSSYKPDELNPDLAAASMARDLIAKLPTPAIISKKFAVYQGIWDALNDDGTNNTCFDCRLRLAIYGSVARTSVNIDGKLFTSLFSYLSKPKIIMQGMAMGHESSFDEEKPGFISGLISRLRGKPQESNS
jgi:hypothetical protein